MSRILIAIHFCLLLGPVFTHRGGKREGDFCYHYGNPGQCILATECVKTFDRPWSELRACGYSGVSINAETIVCCPAATTTTTPRPVATPPPRQYKQTTTEYVSVTYDYEVNPAVEQVVLAPDGCTPLAADKSTPPQNIKSWDKCLDYQMRVVYPCEESASLMRGKVRRDKCHHNADELIVGGKDARRDEFPHMALLGFGNSNSTAVWKCAGTIISDRFILTAAHCTWTRSSGALRYAIVGSLKRSDDVDASQVHRIISRTKHPKFNVFTLHNDIALLKTAATIQFSPSVVPACLDVFGDDQARAVATGWGATSHAGGIANTLQKVILTKFTDRECRDNYPVNRYGGVYNATMQVCYGDYERAADSCQGDSGGPLTVHNHRLRCMYTVVAVTSSGMHCGNVGVPGYYTRVAPFVPWIESIVWP